MSDAGFGPNATPDGDADIPRLELGELIERLRQSGGHLPAVQSAEQDLKLLSRAIRELKHAFGVFAPFRGQKKVTIFGSARTPRDAPEYKQAERLGRAMVEKGWFVVTGAATGIMEAGHRGAGRENSMGINIMLPFEQSANEVIRGDAKLVTMKYFFTRKLMFVKECDAVVCLPGGFGTLDEAFETLTLLQTGKRELIPLVLLDGPGGNYWNGWLEFIRKQLLATGMISQDDLSLLKITDSVDETVNELTHFYRVFHSMEYVSDRLMLRLRQPVDEQNLATIQNEFSDILSSGQFELREPPPGEPKDPEYSTLSRLSFHFNRRNHGRLRQLIDWLNRVLKKGTGTLDPM